MCLDISFYSALELIDDYFPGLVWDEKIDDIFGPIDHLQAPGLCPKMPIIYVNRDDLKPHVRLMEWGIIRHYSKTEPTIMERTKMFNIRSERILDDKKSYWYLIKNRRCLIPVTGIYEHRGVLGWKKKVPYWIKPEDQDLFFLPGLYSVWIQKDGEGHEIAKRWTFAMITREANEVMATIHNDGENRHRMPLFLPLEKSKEFLSEELSENPERYHEILNYEMPSEDLVYQPVYTIRTNKLRPDNKQHKFDYYEWENLPPLGEAMPM
jgi:putative SOS response-associated peptidase YedK